MNLPVKKGILFDLDNTLLPSRICHQQAMKSVETLLNTELNVSTETSADIIKFYKILLAESSVDPEKNSDFKNQRIALWNKSLNHFNVTNTDGETLYEHVQKEFLKDMVFSKEVVSVLLNLRARFKIAIITNGDSYFQRLKLERCKAMKFVDEVFVSGEHKLQKPDPKFFDLVCHKIGLKNDQCVIVGDSLYSDIFGGQQSNLKATIQLTMYNTIEKPILYNLAMNIKPDFSIATLYDLEGCLSEINW